MFDFMTQYQKNFWTKIMFPAFSSTFQMLFITTLVGTLLGFVE